MPSRAESRDTKKVKKKKGPTPSSVVRLATSQLLVSSWLKEPVDTHSACLSKQQGVGLLRGTLQ